MVSDKKLRFNRIVTVVVRTAVQNDQGGNEADQVRTYKRWADVKDRQGSNSNPYQQQVWNYDYVVTLRRNKQNPTQSNYEILYQNQLMKIEYLKVNTEGFQQYEVLGCSKIDGEVIIEGS